MENNKPTGKLEQPISLSYIDLEKGFQLNAQSIDDILEHISPEFILLRTSSIKRNDYVIELYANKEALEDKH